MYAYGCICLLYAGAVALNSGPHPFIPITLSEPPPLFSFSHFFSSQPVLPAVFEILPTKVLSKMITDAKTYSIAEM